MFSDFRIVRDTRWIEAISDPRRAASAALAPVLGSLRGKRVAVTAGSRGISNIGEILAGAVGAVRSAGGDPFVVAAMGSHGGGTAEGQREILAHLGVTEASVGAPISTEMDVVELGTTAHGVAVCTDRAAANADAILVVGRVKPHTDFSGTIESGLLKMLAIGLGKAVGAKRYHAAFAKHDYESIIREVATLNLEKLPIAAGLAIVEDHRGNTNTLEGIAPAAFVREEERLLVHARDLLSRLPFANLDLLVIDEMGKNYSGTGMDTNVTGRAVDGRSQKSPTPVIDQLFVRKLSPHSDGNANGIGLADFCTKTLADSIDWPTTYLNVLTAAQPACARLPVVCASDREAIEYALVAAGIDDPREARIVRIANTLHMDTLVASKRALADLENIERYSVEDRIDAFAFDRDGNIPPIAMIAHSDVV